MLGKLTDQNLEDLLETAIREDGHSLLAYARALTGHAQDAEDALQEAFERVAGCRSSQIGNLRAYLFRAVHNAAANSFRSRFRRSRREEASGPQALAVFQEPMDRQEEVCALNEAIASLPGEQREVIMMKVWGGLSFTEVADALGIPRDTAASRYRYAMDTLRKQMRKFTDAQQ